MKIQGRVSKVLPVRSGVSQRTGNEWEAMPFVVEYFEYETDRFPDSVMLETFDEKVIAGMKEGMEVSCTIGHRTREYEGRVYNELRLYNIECVRKVCADVAQPQAATAQPQQQAPAAPANEAKVDDLPF